MLMGRGRFRNRWSLGAVTAIAAAVAWLLYLLWRTPSRDDLSTYGIFALSGAVIVVGSLAWAWPKRTTGAASPVLRRCGCVTSL